MAITSIITYVDKDEYSRFELDRNTITVTVQAVSTVAGTETFQVDLIKARRTRDTSIYTTNVSITFPAIVPPATTSSASVSTGIDLTSLIETGTNGRITGSFNIARRGMYFVKAIWPTSPSVRGDSPDFPLSLVTLDRFRRDFLFGLELSSFDIRKPKYQPATVTGVEITELSRQHEPGFFPLTFNSIGSPVPSRTLSWAGGPLIPISAPGSYVLPSKNKDNFAVVRVASLQLLPAAHQTDEIIVDKDTMDAATIRAFLERATDWLENTELQIFLEPTHVLSDNAGFLKNDFSTDYDVVRSPVTLYPRTPGHWVDIQLPVLGLLQVRKMLGAINANKILSVSPDWIELSEHSGLIQLVPFSQEYAFNFVGLVWVEGMRGPVPIPNFWHYDVFAGIRDLPADLREAIGKKAAIEVMTIAGMAFRSVLSGQNVGRDGVYESVSYFNSGRGLYGSVIQEYQQFLDATLPKYRNRYRGPNLWVA